MALISRVIENGRHISGRGDLDSQTWETFENIVRGKKFFLFGLGKGAGFYFGSKWNKHELTGIIDNDTAKQGIRAQWFLPKEADYACGNLRISDISVVRQYPPEEVVVLITSLRGYREICEQLESYGIHQNYALLPMEANWRKNHNYELEKDVEQYIKECYESEIDPKKIVFYNQNTYGGHGKYITEQLLKIRNDLKIVWIVNDPHIEVPDEVQLLNVRNRKRFIYEMETAKVWVFDYFMRYSDIVKRPGQIFIEVKHWAGITLKAFGLDLTTFRNLQEETDLALYNSKIMDYIIVGSKFDENTCRRGFAFDGEICMVGSPRSDILFSPLEVKKKVFEKYLVDDKIYVCLYAPTFRLDASGLKMLSRTDLDFGNIIRAFENRFGGKWYIFLKLHPIVAAQSSDVEKPEGVIDVSDYPDSQELVAASDVLITDYSSIMFEPAFVKKPVFLLATDREEYIGGERELLIDYDTLPFPLAESNEELVRRIQEFNQQEYDENVTQFLDGYGVHEDGHASERAAAFISELIGNTEANVTE